MGKKLTFDILWFIFFCFCFTLFYFILLHILSFFCSSSKYRFGSTEKKTPVVDFIPSSTV
ncbi:hypothetical protein BDV29DRAFT_174628 [Aspergillus leporis]|uniref:Uncharacterized protein n=1 Tax=Aspergillus leporis TaxID=41062 RepID=A0A5N5WZR7_9EURO|nr:hypothetical protein BDV29DRAFT_174628 [Aspergillus leporis]